MTTGSEQGTVGGAEGGVPRRRSKPVHIIAWVLQVLLALAMAGAGVTKLTAMPAMVQLFADIGAGQWLRLLVGGLEIAGAVGLLIPRLRAWAALGLVLLLAGATFTNVVILHVNTLVSVGYGLLALVVLLLRRGELTRSRPR